MQPKGKEWEMLVDLQGQIERVTCCESGNHPQAESYGLQSAFVAIRRLLAIGYDRLIRGFDESDFCWICIQTWILSLTFLINLLVDNSFGKQQDLELNEISVYLGLCCESYFSIESMSCKPFYFIRFIPQWCQGVQRLLRNRESLLTSVRWVS